MTKKLTVYHPSCKAKELVQEGFCPYCKKVGTDLGSLEFDNSFTIARTVSCEECGKKWFEWYTLDRVAVEGGVESAWRKRQKIKLPGNGKRV